MDAKIEIFIEYLFNNCENLKDIVKSFEWCSRYNDGKTFLVSDKTLTIDFDKFTSRIRKGNTQSADSLSFNDSCAIMIEFKSGDPTTHERKIRKLIDNVIGKINDSDDTMTLLYQQCFPKANQRLKQQFFLVVDSKKMGIEPLLTTLADLSMNKNYNAKEKAIFEQVKPDLLKGVEHPDHYLTIDVWYSELFSTYLGIYKIKDIEIPCG